MQYPYYPYSQNPYGQSGAGYHLEHLYDPSLYGYSTNPSDQPLDYFQYQPQYQSQAFFNPEYQPLTNSQFDLGSGWNEGYQPFSEYGAFQPGDQQPMTPSQKQALMQYFQGEDGEIDLDKVFKTLGQVVQITQQISPVIKGLNSMVRSDSES